MDNHQLNLLIKKIIYMKEQKQKSGDKPFSDETLAMLVSQLNEKFGIFLNEMLFEIYDEHCEDGAMEALENYLSPEGVDFEAKDQPGKNFALKLRPFPLRFVLEQDDVTRSLKVA